MKKVIFLFLILIVVSISPFAHAHKLISHDDSHRDYESALVIPDHKISWAISDNLGVNETKFYTFDAKKGDSFYASIVIPKLDGLQNYSPSLVLVNDDLFNNDSSSSNIESNIEKYLYEGDYPGNEFYEPFGQVTYWERQEITTIIPDDGQYFILVLDEKNQSGKYALAVGTIEDFSGSDFFTVLPKAWFDTKLFFNDYVSFIIAISILIGLPSMFLLVLLKKIYKK